jgi:hypothetical protein
MSLTYNGSTAGSTLANPPVLLAGAIGGHVQFVTSGSTAGVSNLPIGASGAKLWFYSSSNSGTELAGAAAISDGPALGMSLGDVIIGVQTTAASTAPLSYLGVLCTSAGSTSFCLSSSFFTSTAA